MQYICYKYIMAHCRFKSAKNKYFCVYSNSWRQRASELQLNHMCASTAHISHITHHTLNSKHSRLFTCISYVCRYENSATLQSVSQTDTIAYNTNTNTTTVTAHSICFIACVYDVRVKAAAAAAATTATAAAACRFALHCIMRSARHIANKTM